MSWNIKWNYLALFVWYWEYQAAANNAFGYEKYFCEEDMAEKKQCLADLKGNIYANATGI